VIEFSTRKVILLRSGGTNMQKAMILFFLFLVSILLSDPIYLLTLKDDSFEILFGKDMLGFQYNKILSFPTVPLELFLPRNCDKELMKAVAEVESSFKIHALSKAGAMGLFQLMPETAKDLGVNNPYNPWEASRGAWRYIEKLKEEFGNVEKALLAYHDGPGNVRKGRISNAGKEYVKKVLEEVGRVKDSRVKDTIALSPGIVYENGSIKPYISITSSVLGFLDWSISISENPCGRVDLRMAHYFSLIFRMDERSLKVGTSFVSRRNNLEFLIGKEFLSTSMLLDLGKFDLRFSFLPSELVINVVIK